MKSHNTVLGWEGGLVSLTMHTYFELKHIAVCISSSFHYTAENVPLHAITCLPAQLLRGLIDVLFLGALTRKAAVNICVYIKLCVHICFHFSGGKSRSLVSSLFK